MLEDNNCDPQNFKIVLTLGTDVPWSIFCALQCSSLIVYASSGEVGQKRGVCPLQKNKSANSGS